MITSVVVRPRFSSARLNVSPDKGISALSDGALEGSDHVLYLDKHRINEETMEFSLIVDERPAYVGIDPYKKLIDRNSDDNLVRVTID